MAPTEHNSVNIGPGDKLGDYQLLVQVGTGGMGRVWAARRVGSAKAPLVAVKTGLGETGGGPEFARLFVDEARIASLIDHPNVCAVHELGDQNGVLYLVMEWCDGATLRDMIDAAPDHRLPLDVAARIIADVASGLHAAHELLDDDGEPMQVVHRDVSPQNVLVWSQGQVKVADFGVAKARGQLHRPTETGEVKGKLSYMAPEQVTSPRIDRRADVFGLGCVLYEATVGRRPYHGGDALTTLYQLLERETVTPRSIDPDFPPDLEAIVMRSLAKTADGRYPTALEMSQALEGWMHSHRAIVPPSRVAIVVRETVGTIIADKRKAIAETVAKLDDDRPLPDSLPPLAGVETNEPTVRPISERELERRRSSSLRPARGRVDRLAVAGLGVGAIILAATVLVLVARRPAQSRDVATATVTAGASASATPAKATPAPSLAVITIRAEPPSATLQLDDQVGLPNPLVRKVTIDGTSHVVVASAPGFTPVTERVVFDRDHDVVVRLKPVDATPGTATRPIGPPPTVTRPPPPPTGTRVRPIDEENPFARRP